MNCSPSRPSTSRTTTTYITSTAAPPETTVAWTTRTESPVTTDIPGTEEINPVPPATCTPTIYTDSDGEYYFDVENAYNVDFVLESLTDDEPPFKVEYFEDDESHLILEGHKFNYKYIVIDGDFYYYLYGPSDIDE